MTKQGPQTRQKPNLNYFKAKSRRTFHFASQTPIKTNYSIRKHSKLYIEARRKFILGMCKKANQDYEICKSRKLLNSSLKIHKNKGFYQKKKIRINEIPNFNYFQKKILLNKVKASQISQTPPPIKSILKTS